jgi:hypothetical protein
VSALKAKEKRLLKNDALCVESGFPIGTLGNDGVGKTLGSDGVGATFGNNAKRKRRRLQVKSAIDDANNLAMTTQIIP